jgi:uncharacterized protein (UPF0548 family)
VGVHLRRLTDADLAALLARCTEDDLTYAPVGAAFDGTTPKGFHRHHWHAVLGADAFGRATGAIRSWEMHRRAGLGVAVDGPIAVGTNVALSAPLPIGFVDATCRIVEVVDDSNRYGFAYGTLPVHPEMGEEAFVVTRDDERTYIDIYAISRPAHPFARAIPFLAQRLQDAAVRRYLAAISSIVAKPERRT